MKKINRAVFKKVNELELERERLISYLQESTKSLSELRLVNENLDAKVKTLTSDLEKSNIQHHSFMSGSKKLDNLLGLNKPTRNNEGQGYNQIDHNTASTSRH